MPSELRGWNGDGAAFKDCFLDAILDSSEFYNYVYLSWLIAITIFW